MRVRWTGCVACVFMMWAVAPAVMAQQPSATRESQALGQPRAGERSTVKPTQRGPKSVDRGWATQTAVPLAIVLGAVIGGGVLVRKAARRWGGFGALVGPGGRSPAGLLEVLGRYPVGRGVTLVLLKLDSRVLLLSQSAGGRFGAGANFTTLAEVTQPEEVASILVRARDAEGDSMAEKFRGMLQRFDSAPSGSGSSESSSKEVELWDGSRSNIPVIDLTQRKPVRGNSLRDRIAGLRRPASSSGGRG